MPGIHSCGCCPLVFERRASLRPQRARFWLFGVAVNQETHAMEKILANRFTAIVGQALIALTFLFPRYTFLCIYL